MPKKEPSAAQLAARKKFAEQARARAAAKKAEKELPDEAYESFQHPEPTEKNTISPEEYQDLLRRMLEMQEMFINNNRAATPANTLGVKNGSVIGEIDKYLTDPDLYPDPCKRLAKEPRLQPFAFEYNYELKFQVGITSYETKSGVNMREPKFTLELYRIMLDDSGVQTNKRMVICRGIFHEDPQTAIVIARDNGIQIEGMDEPTFLNEMRYLRMRDWVIEQFFPPKPSQEKIDKHEEVIGGKLVEIFSINSEQSETIPFNELNTKL
jgi:hypothetical protein